MNKPIDKDKIEAHPLPEPCASTVQSVKDAASESEAPATSQMTSSEIDRMTTDIIDALKTVYDPEIPVDIYELGLIYKIDIGEDRKIEIDMTLTAPGCPVAGEMPVWVQNAVSNVEGVQDVKVNMVFEPFWTMDRMSEEAKFALNMF